MTLKDTFRVNQTLEETNLFFDKFLSKIQKTSPTLFEIEHPDTKEKFVMMRFTYVSKLNDSLKKNLHRLRKDNKLSSSILTLGYFFYLEKILKISKLGNAVKITLTIPAINWDTIEEIISAKLKL